MNTQGLILRTIFGQLVVVLPSVGNAQFRRQMTHSTRVFSNCSTSLSLQSFSMSPPELLLGRNGVYRISILGNSGSGKSTLGRHLSKHLQVPHLSIDELFWNPGWVPTQSDVLRDQVQKFIESNPDGWIVDGNYTRMIGSIVQDAATDVLFVSSKQSYGKNSISPPPVRLYLVLQTSQCHMNSLACENNSRPLVGGKDGVYKIAISIAHGSHLAKSTLASQLSEILNIPYLPLDEVYWAPGWVRISPEIFQTRVKTFLNSHPQGWIVDGNYTPTVGLTIQDAATDILWLDPPLMINFWRVLRRTLGRMFLGKSTCAPGCREHILKVLGSRGILVTCITQHRVCRDDFTGPWERENVEGGKGKWRRFSGWGSDLQHWLLWLKQCNAYNQPPY
ncbi:unnamed protein product [Rhizoctonia solani]|uniref:Adenylate kinase n=1 Tax=Rhizoctonia solani TaxID=456999 RepID=A0A8H3D1Q1_9AGAM|nr:unnamed protein product [Rhizoctonia solani]